MARVQSAGCYGKIPQRGDFITRNLDSQLVTNWDDWLQDGMRQSRERHGEGWIDHYMISPVWRFAAGSGVLDQSCWLGVMIPSVDRVGRYFPFTVMVDAGDCSPLEAMVTRQAWFDAAEALALDSLADEFEPESLEQRLADLPNPSGQRQEPIAAARPLGEASRQYQLGQGISSGTLLTRIASDSMRELCPALSVWWTQGSAHVAASLLLSPGLPSAAEFAAMLDGEFACAGWAEGGWLGESGIGEPEQA